MSTAKTNWNGTALTWSKDDLECRVGFNGGRFTKTNVLFTFLNGLGISIAFYAIITIAFQETAFGAMFTQRGFTPYAMTMLFCWSLVTIFVKWRKLKYQVKCLRLAVVPEQADFVLSVSTVEQVISSIRQQVDDSRRFLLFNRIFVALSNLRNLGRVTDSLATRQ